MLKFISWNVNGLRACYDKGFADVFNRLEADFFCLQETKMQEGQLDVQFEGYQSYWNYAEKKGYSGTAIFSKVKPLSVTYGLGIEEHDHEGRVITLELESYYLITVYTPNSQEELRRLDYRMKWDDDFRAYLKKLEEKKPVIVCGDLNVAQVSLMKSVQSSLLCLNQVLRIHSAISIRSKREFTHGGPIVSKPVRRMRVGVLIIFSLPIR